MAFTDSFSKLMRQKSFRKLLAVRIVTQASDGTLQVGMASYVLFSPESQPNALAIATVLAITLMPFSVLAPFASIVLDRWSRQRVLVITDACRAVIALALAGMVRTGSRDPRIQLVMYLLLLVAMSANRFLLAGLTAGLPYTVRREHFITASSIMPMIGPLGVLIGAGVAGGLRMLLSPRFMPTHEADAVVFVTSAVLFCISVLLAFRFKKHDLGPDPTDYRPSAKQVLLDMKDAWDHLGDQGPASIGLRVITAARILFGLTSVGVILGYRNHFHSVTQVNAAMADIGVWVVVAGVGFVLSAVVVPPIAHGIGLRKTLLLFLVVSALAQGVSTIFERIPLLIGAFFLGLMAQSIKVVVDTVCQLHVDDDYKGRVFVLYDILFNMAFVIAAVLAIWVLPPDGFDHLAFALVGVAYLVLGAIFWWQSARYGDIAFNMPQRELPAQAGHHDD